MRPRWVTHTAVLGSLQDTEEEKRPCDHRGRGWGDAVTSPGTLGAPGSWEEAPWSLRRERSPADTLSSGSGLQNRENKVLLFRVARVGGQRPQEANTRDEASPKDAQ